MTCGVPIVAAGDADPMALAAEIERWFADWKGKGARTAPPDFGKPKAPKGITAEQVAVMERETAQLDREIKVAEQSFGPDHMQLVFARGYVAKLLENERILRWLTNHQPDVLAEFRKITEMEAAPA